MMPKKKQVPEHVNTITTIGVIGGIYLGIKKDFGVGKTILCVIAFGVGANYLANTYYNYQNSNNEQ